MSSNSKFNIKKYHASDLQTLSLNIFPNGETILHYAHKHLYIIRRFYKVIEREDTRRRKKAEDEDCNMTNFEIPFIKNFNGDTPIHLCIKNENYKSADVILSKLCNTDIDSHSRQIVDCLPGMIKADIPSLKLYFDSRLIQTD